ncbi:MAG: TraB/GumN family protein [Neisseria sp.]|nr:TraB/GumN family protein [Neisseria sp.]
MMGKNLARRIAIFLLALLPAMAAAFDWHTPQMASRLWKISKAGQPDSYLLGTHHVGREGDTLPDGIRRILLQSDRLITEVAMPSKPDAAYGRDVAAMRARAFQNGGRKLSAVIGVENVAALKKRAAAYPPTAASAARLDEMTAWGALMLQSSIKPRGFQTASGVDRLLARAAEQYRIPAYGLESYNDITRPYEILPEARIAELIAANNRHPEQTAAQTERQYTLYQTGRLQELMRLSADSGAYGKGLPPESIAFWQNWLEQSVLLPRNRAWLPKILNELPKRRNLIAVGIAHLPDEGGLIMQLRRQGYTVEPVIE